MQALLGYLHERAPDQDHLLVLAARGDTALLRLYRALVVERGDDAAFLRAAFLLVSEQYK